MILLQDQGGAEFQTAGMLRQTREFCRPKFLILKRSLLFSAYPETVDLSFLREAKNLLYFYEKRTQRSMQYNTVICY